MLSQQSMPLTLQHDNHEHGNLKCKITINIHNKMTKKILATIEKSNPKKKKKWIFPTWFSHSTQDPHI